METGAAAAAVAVASVAALAALAKCTTQYAQIVDRRRKYPSSRPRVGRCTAATVSQRDARPASKQARRFVGPANLAGLVFCFAFFGLRERLNRTPGPPVGSVYLRQDSGKGKGCGGARGLGALVHCASTTSSSSAVRPPRTDERKRTGPGQRALRGLASLVRSPGCPPAGEVIGK